uniref:Uncharacterized protein n=1 Tax=Lepeophtheirus salmonis TaxID=72036 RepID=A0A0K2U1H1_LEPSM
MKGRWYFKVSFELFFLKFFPYCSITTNTNKMS